MNTWKNEAKSIYIENAKQKTISLGRKEKIEDLPSDTEYKYDKYGNTVYNSLYYKKR